MPMPFAGLSSSAFSGAQRGPLPQSGLGQILARQDKGLLHEHFESVGHLTAQKARFRKTTRAEVKFWDRPRTGLLAKKCSIRVE